MVEIELNGLEEFLVNLGFEEERKFHYSEFVEISKELVERMKGGLIGDFAVVRYFDDLGSLNYVLYIQN